MAALVTRRINSGSCTLELLAGIRWWDNKVKASFDLEFGYKAVDVDYESGDAADDGYFAYDATMHGPLLGLVIKF